jgi:hypothetical protein
MAGYGDAGGADNYGGGDGDYSGYGDRHGIDVENPNHNVIQSKSNMTKESYANSIKQEKLQAMFLFLKNVLDILTDYEIYKYNVKATPYRDEILEISERVKYLQKLLTSTEFKKHRDYESESVRVKNTVSECKVRKEWLQQAEHTITVEKIDNLNKINMYYDARSKFCTEGNKDYRLGYDPREDPELQERLSIAKAYIQDYSRSVSEELDSKKHTQVKNTWAYKNEQ